jgi:hypothetical protein
MKLELGSRLNRPKCWYNMVIYVRNECGVLDTWYWEDGYEKIAKYLYENFRGKLIIVDGLATCIEFEKDEDYTWFILRWS